MASFGYNTLSSGSYNSDLYSFMALVEGDYSTPYLDSGGVPTIGVGFNLRTNLDAVLLKIFYPEEDHASILTADATYESEIATAVAASYGSNAALQTALNTIMAAREVYWVAAIAADPTIDHPAGTISSTFSFANDGLVQDVFTALQPTYETRVDDNIAGPGDISVPDLQERIALYSLGYQTSSFLGSGLDTAIGAGNRAEAWWEIRYDTDTASSPRHYYESQEFGLYNPGTLDLAEARQIFQMVTRHDSGGISDTNSMDYYDSVYSAAAIAAYPTVQSTAAALEPAKEFLVGDYAPGASIDKVWVAYGAIDGSGDTSSTLDYSSGATNALIIGGNVGCTITGGSGNDWIVGGQGNNTIDGGAGSNTVSFAQDPAGVTVDLATGTATDGWGNTDTLLT